MNTECAAFGHVVGDERLVDAPDAVLPVGAPLGHRADEAHVRMPAGQPLQFVPEREFLPASRGVEEGDRPARIRGHAVAQHADERRDPDAAGDERDRAVVPSRVGESSRGRLHEQLGPGPQRRVQRARHEPLALHGNLQIAGGLGRRTDRVAPDVRLPVHLHANGEKLAGVERERAPGARGGTS